MVMVVQRKTPLRKNPQVPETHTMGWFFELKVRGGCWVGIAGSAGLAPAAYHINARDI